MLTFKAKKGDDMFTNMINFENQTNVQMNENNPLENLEQIEKHISPINNKRISFSNGFDLNQQNYFYNKDFQADKKTEKSTYYEKHSQQFTQALNQYNPNSIELSRFQDFVLSSQNNNSLHFDINNINFIINQEEDKDYFGTNTNTINNNNYNNYNLPQEETSAYKKKIIKSLNHKLTNNKGISKIPSPIKEEIQYVNEDLTKATDAIKFEENKETNKIEILNKYKHVFGDVEHNTSRSGRSYYESHHKSARKQDVEGDFTNFRNNNSVMSTEKTIRNGVLNEDEKVRKRYHSTHLKNLIQNVNIQKENIKAYNFNSNLFMEEQKLRSSKEMSSK